MAVSATVSPGTILTEGEAVTISKLNALGTPTVDISGSVGSLAISTNSINNDHLQAAAAIQYDKLATLNTGQLLVGNAGTPTAATLSGDATIDASGALTIAAGAVEEAMLASGVNTVPTGCISMWYTGSPPDGWLTCDGSTFDASTYADLNTLLGGNTLPNLKGRVPVGLDSGQTEFDTIGETGGAGTVTLTASQIPAHSHNINTGADGGAHHGHTAGNVPTGLSGSQSQVGTTYTGSHGVQDNTGGGGAHDNLQPYIVVNFIIKT